MSDSEILERMTFADVRVRCRLWVCRWCRVKAERICDLKHRPWCKLQGAA